jgi:hypothetical protein
MLQRSFATSLPAHPRSVSFAPPLLTAFGSPRPIAAGEPPGECGSQGTPSLSSPHKPAVFVLQPDTVLDLAFQEELPCPTLECVQSYGKEQDRGPGCACASSPGLVIHDGGRDGNMGSSISSVDGGSGSSTSSAASSIDDVV